MMAVLALTLGVISLALSVLLTLGLMLSVIGLAPFFLGALAVFILITVGLVLTIMELFRRRGRGKVAPISALAVNVVALGAAIVAAVIIFGDNEPDYDDAMRQLVSKSGVGAVQRIGLGRPALLAMPEEYSQVPLEQRGSVPLVLSLHGYSSHYMAQDSYFGLSELMDSHHFALILPNGTRDEEGNRFWNATELCCGVSDSRPDDVAYLKGLVAEAAEHVNIERVFVVGMSNGAFMSYRLACEGMPELAGIVAVAGSSYSDPARCDSARPISVLHIHGTEDETIRIEGGSNPEIGEGSYPAAREVAERWARRAGCGLSATVTPQNLDIDERVGGSETRVIHYGASGCQDGLSVEFWEMEGSSHIPRLSDEFGQRIVDWLLEGPG